MQHVGKLLGTGNGGTVIDCQDCGYAHLDPLPTQAETVELYQDHYYQAHNAGFAHKAHGSHFDEQEEDLEWHRIGFAENLSRFDSIAPRKDWILDYGAGAGWFVNFVRTECGDLKHGWSISGVEPSLAARIYADETTDTHLASKLRDKEHKYSAIRAYYVLEHLLDPRQALQELGERLLPGGVLCVAVPNEFNAWACAGRDKFGLDSYWIRPGLHLNYFTHESIAKLLCDTGYEVVDQLATFPTELFMLGGLDFASDPDLGHRLHHLRMNIELAVDEAGFGAMKLELYRWLAKRGLGRASVTYARKGVS